MSGITSVEDVVALLEDERARAAGRVGALESELAGARRELRDGERALEAVRGLLPAAPVSYSVADLVRQAQISEVVAEGLLFSLAGVGVLRAVGPGRYAVTESLPGVPDPLVCLQLIRKAGPGRPVDAEGLLETSGFTPGPVSKVEAVGAVRDALTALELINLIEGTGSGRYVIKDCSGA
ncbi:hypothetical protein ABZ663_32300 [Streptomyces albidoflavus]|uniref:hypothetical protein n=1 Tax=Streptomyces albidoflavus TaxID=1886 RepID=UPI0033C9347C